VPLFEAHQALAIADATPAHVQAAHDFAVGVEHYINNGLYPLAGFGAFPGQSAVNERTWYDDNGWFGLAFLDAYTATHDRRFIEDAKIAEAFVNQSGWDPVAGGLFWNTDRERHAGETLATGTLLAAKLYALTGDQTYLQNAQRNIEWGSHGEFNTALHLYQRTEYSGKVFGYIQSPMIAAHALLCRQTHQAGFCEGARTLTDATAHYFGLSADMGPQFDHEYMRWLLDAYRITGDGRLYAIVKFNAGRIVKNARGPSGLFSRAWDGGPLSAHGSASNRLQTHAASASVLAWLSATPAS
jgi:hypothetical protein